MQVSWNIPDVQIYRNYIKKENGNNFLTIIINPVITIPNMENKMEVCEKKREKK